LRRRHLVPVALLAIAMMAVGCAAPGTAISTPYGSTPPALEHGPHYEVKVANIAGLGPVLVDGQGIALYLFESDHQGSPSTCYNICAIQWPPLLVPTEVTRPIAGPGVETRLLGTAPRRDGTTQVTYNGWPLYLWPPDHTPGKATGQGLTNAGGRWYVVNASGNAVETT
jgi:predicted lipoprotein with Yx(FWY)xxD motif